MPALTKVTDYNATKVRQNIVSAYKKHSGDVTIADVIAFTGLPKVQVERELPAVADEFQARLKVTESGEILYSFPKGFHSKYRGFIPSLKRFFSAFGKGLKKVATILFKIWIMVMLIGYFALFIALAVLSVVLTIAASMSGKGENKSSNSRSSRGGGLLSMRLIELIVRIWFYNDLLKTPEQRRYETNQRVQRRENKDRSPLHKSIFNFVFGDPDPNAEQDKYEKQAFVSLVRIKQGVILLEDFMSITGLSPEEADKAINQYLYEFEGSPEVTEDGTIYYHFPSLLMRAKNDLQESASSPMAKLRDFSTTPKKANIAFSAINGVNLLFGSYFLICAGANIVSSGFGYLYVFTATLLQNIIGLSAATSFSIMIWGLGVVPIIFSILFWGIPLVRSLLLKMENEEIKESNLRRIIYSMANANPSRLAPPELSNLPKAAKPKMEQIPKKIVEELAAYEEADLNEDGSWKLKELDRRINSINKLRKEECSKFELGNISFDTESNN